MRRPVGHWGIVFCVTALAIAAVCIALAFQHRFVLDESQQDSAPARLVNKSNERELKQYVDEIVDHVIDKGVGVRLGLVDLRFEKDEDELVTRIMSLPLDNVPYILKRLEEETDGIKAIILVEILFRISGDAARDAIRTYTTFLKNTTFPGKESPSEKGLVLFYIEARERGESRERR